MTSAKIILNLSVSTLLTTSLGCLSTLPSFGAEGAGSEPIKAETSVIATEEKPIDNLNAQFRKCYGHAKADVLAKSGPVLIVASSKISLYKDGKLAETHEYVPASYSALKTMDHLPLAIFVELVGKTDQPLSENALDDLQKLKDLSTPAAKALLDMGMGADAIERQKKIVDCSVQFIDKVVHDKTVSRSQLDSFTKANLVESMDNVYDAVALELSEINRVVQRYKTTLGPEQWKRVHVVITGSHMARDKERAMQYFARLLTETNEGDHIIYLEGSDDEAKALDLLATHMVDSQIALSYFGDKWRMHRDLLSDAAKKYLDAHPPQ